MRSNERCRSGQAQAFECNQVFVRGSRRISQGRAVAANGREHGFQVRVEQIDDERVGMLRGKTMGRQAIGREVTQVAGHDQVRSAFNRRGQHVQVAGVGQIEARGPCRVSCHNGIGKVLAHHRAGSLQYFGRETGAVRQNAPHPFRVDVRAP